MDAKTLAAFTLGQTRGKALVGARNATKAAKLLAGGPQQFPGFLIVEGDSWLNYPIFDEITEKLEDDHGYRIESAARFGDTAENILFTQGGDGKKLVKTFEKLKNDKRVPRAILLSCGGNDVAGDSFVLFLNHRLSPSPGLNLPIVDAVFSRLETTMVGVIGLLKEMGNDFYGKDIPVVIHGYGRLVPDGRGFLGVSLFSGPWLAPSFEQQGYTNLQERVDIMTTLIDRFNDMQAAIAAAIPGVGRVDARGVLSNVLPEKYEDDWANEIHPTGGGFGKVANLFDTEIKKFPLPAALP